MKKKPILLAAILLLVMALSGCAYYDSPRGYYHDGSYGYYGYPYGYGGSYYRHGYGYRYHPDHHRDRDRDDSRHRD